MEQKDSKNILIIVADFYEEISSNLKNGATNYLKKKKYSYDIKSVPGTLEIPFLLTNFSKKYDAFLVLSCIIKGETDHYEIVKNIALKEIYKIAYANNLIMGSGIITANNYEQALSRSKISKENYGGRAADACHKLLSLIYE